MFLSAFINKKVLYKGLANIRFTITNRERFIKGIPHFLIYALKGMECENMNKKKVEDNILNVAMVSNAKLRLLEEIIRLPNNNKTLGLIHEMESLISKVRA